jgi:hypothetical protein
MEAALDFDLRRLLLLGDLRRLLLLLGDLCRLTMEAVRVLIRRHAMRNVLGWKHSCTQFTRLQISRSTQRVDNKSL